MIAAAPVRRYASIDSTNLEAHRLFAAGERGAMWLLADEQTAGKGRLGRTWVSAKGNCYSTLVLPLPGLTAASVPQAGFVVALAASDVVAQFASNVRLKWPNDVLVDGAKISGVLCEVLSQGTLTLAIGCGINVAHAPQGMNYPTACLADYAVTSRDAVFDAYRARLGHWLEVWREGFSALREAWKARAIGIGEIVNIGAVHGVFEDLSADGALVIRSRDGELHTVHAGDLVIPSLQHIWSKSA